MPARPTLTEESINFIDLALGGISDGSWVFVLAKNADRDTAHHFRIRHGDLKERLAEIQMYEKSNYYISANGFMGGKKRTESTLYSLNNIVIDIDCHRKQRVPGLMDMRIDHLVHTIIHDGVDEYGLLMPNAIVYTGRGLQLWWFHESLSAKSNRFTWDAVGNHLLEIVQQILTDNKSRDPYESFAGLSVDLAASFSPAGVYRIPGTRNVAAKCKAESTILSKRRYTLAELKEFNGEHKKKVNYYARRLQSDCTNWALRMLNAIEYLRSSRDAEVGDETRNNYCFTYYCMLRAAGFDTDEVEANLAMFNSKFIKPMTSREIDSSLCTARRKGYKLSTRAVGKLLDVTPEEEEKLRSLFNVNCGEKASRKEEMEAKKKKVLSLYKRGRYTLKEIASKAGVCVPTVRKILKENGCTAKGSRNEKILALKETGYTAEEVAAKVGCSLSTVWRVLRESKKHKADEESFSSATLASPSEASLAAPSAPTFFNAVSCQKENKNRNNGYLYPGGAGLGLPSGDIAAPIGETLSLRMAKDLQVRAAPCGRRPDSAAAESPLFDGGDIKQHDDLSLSCTASRCMIDTEGMMPFSLERETREDTEQLDLFSELFNSADFQSSA